MAKKINREEELKKFYDEKVPLLLRRPADMPVGSSHTVTVNGVNYQIMYDEEVMVPRKVKLVVDEKLRNEKLAEIRMAGMAARVQKLNND